MHIILFQPQIPQNTGNIVRTCSVTGTSLTLVRPLGFRTGSRDLKRAGLDYWDEVDITYIDDLFEHLENLNTPFFFFSRHAEKLYTEVNYSADTTLIFGGESDGLPDTVFERWPDKMLRIPMLPGKRCLNLATSVGIGLYEMHRQTGQM
jgi:tRNA (cytidine/uridine-2'-O-)-methyltransferase